MNIIIQIIIGFFTADILAGLFHWFEDRYLSYCTSMPFLDKITEGNELHHYFPRSMLANSYIDNIAYSLPAMFVLIFIIFLINKKFVNTYKYFFISLFIFGSLSNLFHRFSHMRDCENISVVRFFQKTGLLIPHEFHSIHHEKANQKYCVISVYPNYVLDYLNFWEILENIILLFGINPKPMNHYEVYSSIHDHRHFNSKIECPDKPTKKDIIELKEKLKIFKNCR